MRKIILVVMMAAFLMGCAFTQPKPCTITIGEIEQVAWEYFNECKNKPETEEPFFTGTIGSWPMNSSYGGIKMDNGNYVSFHYSRICYPFHPRRNVKVKFNIKDGGAVNIKEII